MMQLRSNVSSVLLACLALLTIPAGLTAAEHPRLFFTADELPALRQKIGSGVHLKMFQRLRSDVGRGAWGTGPYNEAEPYEQSVRAQRCAFLYVLTGDDAWAKEARRLAELRISDRGNWATPRVAGLRLYWHGSRLAMVYDWCHGAPSWDAEFTQRMSAALREHGEVILKSGGSGQNTSPASNWQGSRFAAAGLCFLATDEEVPASHLRDCHRRCDTFLKANLGGKGSRGWNIEGLGYNYFPMGNYVGPFAVALQRHDPKLDLRDATPGARWTLWSVYAAYSKALGGIRPDFGDDNPGVNTEGTLGLAFWFSHRELHPGMVYWYARTVGEQGAGSFDTSRGGTIWSILFHPGDAVKEQDPMQIDLWREGFVDVGGVGYQTYRDRYQDENDMVAQLYAKLMGNKGHSGPDALDFRILGQGTAFAVGGGRYGPKIGGQDAYHFSMNNLYPQEPGTPFKPNANSGRLVGTPVSHPNGSGHVVASIAQNNVGTRDHTRRFVAHHFGSGEQTGAAYVINDTSSDGRYWQLNTLPTHELTTEGNTFTITAANGSSLRGTVLYPTGDLKFKTGTRIRGSNYQQHQENRFLHFQSDDGDYLVVLTVVGKGAEHPRVAASGQWSDKPRGTVTVGDWQATIDGDEVSTGAR